MKLKVVLALSAFLVAVSGTAAAKFVSHRLTVEGPGMGSPGVMRERRSLDRMFVAMLAGAHRTSTKRPGSPGPAYVLEYGFRVGDENGTHIQNIHQTLYPFAPGGPVVFTPRHQKIEMSFGPERFTWGWFEVPRRVLRKLEGVGLPNTAPEPEPTPAASTSAGLDPPSPRWPWVAMGLALLVVGAGAVTALGRRPSRGM